MQKMDTPKNKDDEQTKQLKYILETLKKAEKKLQLVAINLQSARINRGIVKLDKKGGVLNN